MAKMWSRQSDERRRGSRRDAEEPAVAAVLAGEMELGYLDHASGGDGLQD
jgi:hypothetical protein